ncbi:ligand-dependent nuclear receptor-interacting factor 1 [Polypterus senegalus]|uniref:ligand-dependent nuclear receptor-interacting factor 1 n=1 Tax=Polypterus senegalus TaxID=55291 RepID=UPI001963A4A2|nr:ligand-dependent nuclear receptor-interacting factor 1 [Polypterus senegalus]
MFWDVMSTANNISVPVKMNAAVTAPNSNASSTGGMYRVLHAFDASGKKLLKLIPIGPQCIPIVPSHNKTTNACLQPIVEQQKVFTSSPIQIAQSAITQSALPVLEQSSSGKYIIPAERTFVLKPVSTIPVNEKVAIPTTNSSIKVCVPSLIKQKLVPGTSHMVNADHAYSVVNINTHPVSTKPLVLPAGSKLHFSTGTESKAVSTSTLSPGIQEKILATVGSGSQEPQKNVQTVIYLSPVNAVKTAPVNTVKLTPLKSVPLSAAKEAQVTLVKTPAPAVNANPIKDSQEPLKIVSSHVQNPGAPMKWVVQENPDSPAPYLVPVKPNHNSASKILKTLATIEQAGKGAKEPSVLSEAATTQTTSGKDNSLVMCNGKTYLLAKKNPEPTKLQVFKDKGNEAVLNVKTEKPTAETEMERTLKLSLQSSQPTSSSAGFIKRNVTSEKPIVIQDDSDTDVDDSDEIQHVEFSKSSNISPRRQKCVAVQTVRRGICTIAEVIDMTNDYDPITSENHTLSYKESVLFSHGSTVQQSPVDLCEGFSGHEPSKRKYETDSQLRKKFGITSDVKICLQRCSPHKSISLQAKTQQVILNKNPLEGIRKLIQESKADARAKKLNLSQTEVSGKCDPNTSPKQTSECLPPDFKKMKIDSRGDMAIPSSSEENSRKQGVNPHNVHPYENSGGHNFMPSNDKDSVMDEVAHCSKQLDSITSGSSNTSASAMDEDIFIVTPMDSEEIVREEKIKRLKELLKQKETALEEIRKNRVVSIS